MHPHHSVTGAILLIVIGAVLIPLGVYLYLRSGARWGAATVRSKIRAAPRGGILGNFNLMLTAVGIGLIVRGFIIV